MSATIPAWAEVAIGVLVLGGAVFTLIGAVGLVRLETLYQRVHAPTLGSSFGIAGIAGACVIYFSVARGTIALGPALTFLFVTITMPVGLVLLVRASLFRDRAEQVPGIPENVT